MNKKTVLGNFKMNKTNTQIAEYFDGLLPQLKDLKAQVVVCVPATGVQTAGDKTKDSPVWVAGQNINQNEKGAYTGEISANQVKSIGCNYTLVGHSERRQNYHETDEMVNDKVKLALENNLKVVICIGETLEEREQNKTEEVLERQIKIGLKDIKDLSNVIIAYEPIWSISSSGTGIIATNEDIFNATKFIKDTVYDNYASDIRVLYGGSVNENNIEEINKVDNISGVLVGGASLKPEKINKIKEVVLN